jgi:hypothetical protein
MDIKWAMENMLMPFIPESVIAITGQSMFTLEELFSLPHYTSQELYSWGIYVDLLRNIISQMLEAKYTGSATRVKTHGHRSGLLARFGDYDKWDRDNPLAGRGRDVGHGRAATAR